MKQFILAAAVAVAILAAGCGAQDKTPFETLVSNEWMLDEIVYADSSFTLTPPTEIAINFTDSMRVSGNAACNNFFGTYAVEGGDGITISPAGVTRAFCLDMEFEQTYLALLPAVKTYKVNDRELRLSDAEGRTTLIYMAALKSAADEQ